MADQRIEALIDARAETKRHELIERLRRELAAAYEEASFHGRLFGGAMVAKDIEIHRKAARELGDTIISAASEGHSRTGVPLDETARADIEARLREVADGFGRSIGREGPLTGGGRHDYSQMFAQQRETFGPQLMGYWKPRLDAAAADLALPPLEDAGVSYRIEVNAPNYGVLAARIDSITLAGSDRTSDLRDALRGILKASQELPEFEAAEVREIVADLASQAEAPTRLRGLIRTAVQRLGVIFTLAEKANTVASLVERIAMMLGE